jgi:hypothetical protein
MARKKKTTRRRFKSSAKRRRAAPARARSRKSKAVSRRRPAKRNPKGIFSQPAVQYGIAATGGAGIGLALNDRKDLYWMGRSPALIAAVIVLLGANFGLKGRKKQLGYATGIGLMLPMVGGYLADGVNALIPEKTTTTIQAPLDMTGGRTTYRIPTKQQTYQPSAKRQAVQATTSKMKAA